MRVSNWADATAPPCPKCKAENAGPKQHHIEKQQDGSWCCNSCWHGWKA